MDKNVEWVNEQKILRTIKALESNNMNGYLVKDEKELISKIEELVPEGSKVTCGGSMSLFETGVMEHLRSGRYDFLDRNKEGLTGEEIVNIYKSAFFSDAYFTSSNAVTEDGELYNFMDTETYDQVALNSDTVGDALKFVKENEMVKVCSYNGNVFAIEPPLFVELEITETEPGFKGDTATGATKPAIVETGAQVSVPLFVNQGDKIKIDTRTGEYLSRV